MMKTKLPPGVEPISTLPTWSIGCWVLGRSGNWAEITGFGADNERIEINLNGRYAQISLAKVIGWAEKPPNLDVKPEVRPEIKPEVKRETKPKSYAGKLAGAGSVSVVNLLELNALLTGAVTSLAKLAPGRRVEYAGSNRNYQNQYGGKALTVHKILDSDPRWVNCTYLNFRRYLGQVEERVDFTPWIKVEDLKPID